MSDALGVSIKELDGLSLSVRPSETAVPVFIGMFDWKPGVPASDDTCVPIESWVGFTSRFLGPVTVKVNLAADNKVSTGGIKLIDHSGAQALQHYFMNGGGRCYVLPLGVWFDQANYKKTVDWLTKELPTVKDEALKAQKEAEKNLMTKQTEVEKSALVAAKEAASDDLSVLENLDDRNFKEVELYQQKFKDMQAKLKPAQDALDAANRKVDHWTQIESTLLPALESFDEWCESQFPKIAHAIAQHPEITLLVCPQPATELKQKYGLDKAAIYQSLGSLLDRKGCNFLIADAWKDSNGTVVGPLTRNAQVAAYYPDLESSLSATRPDDAQVFVQNTGAHVDVTLASLAQNDNDLYQAISHALDECLRTHKPATLPPSALVAGVYASTDRERGVWKAPANVALKAVSGPVHVLTDADQESLNLAGVNVIRQFADRGTVIWGARTCADDNSKEWRYVPVRRLFNAVERDIREALRAVVFEPNEAVTWTRIRTAVDAYLTRMWRQGALAGDAAREAFFVACGLGITMDEADVRAGQLIVRVGLAAVRPAEFVELEFTQAVGQQ
ncbi:hypothetical protein DIE19_28705 [Burkholderia sp. Bp9126]|nr:hypothetical protein DIE19_28705 [Burkholderia sp. Bp9126]